MKTVNIITAVHDRESMTDMFFYRLIRSIGNAKTTNRFIPVAVVTPKQESVCIDHGVDYLSYQNRPLGAKWNALVSYTQYKYYPDYIMILGSDDFISSSYLEYIDDKINQGYDLINPMDIYYYSLNWKRRYYGECGYYGGKERILGVGRTVSRKILDDIKWKPWDDDINNGMDRCFAQKMSWGKPYRVHRFYLRDTSTYILDIKSDGNIGGIGAYNIEPISPSQLLPLIMKSDEIKRLNSYKSFTDEKYYDKSR